jgi:hypothetical protein
MGSHLQNYVTAIWEVIGERNIHETILPQGVVEIVFNFAESIQGILPYSHVAMLAPPLLYSGNQYTYPPCNLYWAASSAWYLFTPSQGARPAWHSSHPVKQYLY